MRSGKLTSKKTNHVKSRDTLAPTVAEAGSAAQEAVLLLASYRQSTRLENLLQEEAGQREEGGGMQVMCTVFNGDWPCCLRLSVRRPPCPTFLLAKQAGKPRLRVGG